jgi:hypothetical protein
VQKQTRDANAAKSRAMWNMLSSNLKSLRKNDYVPFLFFVQALFVPLALGEINAFLNNTFLICSKKGKPRNPCGSSEEFTRLFSEV